jgi:hypothetical protein
MKKLTMICIFLSGFLLQAKDSYDIRGDQNILGSITKWNKEGTIKITSFRMLDTSVNTNSSAAEVCGELVMPTQKPEFIKITSDYGTKIAVPYYVWAGKDGKFCSVISTHYRRVEVSLE